MKLVTYHGDMVIGYNEDANADEYDAAGILYDIVDDIPESIKNFPQGYIFKRMGPGEYAREPLPPAPSDRIAQLEDEAAMIALELANTQIRLDQSESDQAALLLALVEAEVI